jgi:hypothetical protein
MVQHVYNLPLTADMLHNKLHVSSSTVTSWRWQRFMAETCGSIKAMYCAVEIHPRTGHKGPEGE